jgi:hypothetical protein
VIISASAMSRTLEAAANKLGVELPPAFRAELDAARALGPAAAELEGMTASLVATALTAISEHRDPGSDPEVQRLATLVTLAGSGIRHNAAEYADDRITAAFTAHADTVLARISDAIAGDLAVLENAAEQLDLRRLHDAEPLVLKRANALGVWADATTAQDRADIGLAAVRTVLQVLHVNPGPEYRVPMLAPGCTLDQFVGANAATGPREVNSWTIARTGASLRLVTSVTEYTQACARIVAARQEQQRKADEDQDQKVRREGSSRQWTRVR